LTIQPAGQRRAGRPPSCPTELILRIDDLRREGLSYAAISDELNTGGTPTPAGQPRWHRSYVDRLLHTRHAREVIEAAGRDPA
jgi:hypothetical protein